MILSQEQITELEGIYNLSKNNKDKESKKLLESLRKTISFINYDIQVERFSRWTDFWNNKVQFSFYSENKNLKEIPITVLIYILTKDDKYLPPYSKGERKGRQYIYHGGNCYYIDKFYIPNNDISNIIKNE